jgi:uncharacterized membrane protein
MSWRTRWRIYEYVRNSLWIVPAIFFVLAVALGIVLPDIDENTNTTIGISFGTDAARGVLGAMAGGMITFTGFVFSILLLAVQFGSSQFSPRMLRRFLRDPTTKVSLGVFMATFVYALVVLRVVGTAQNENFVPDNSISVALLFLLLSMLMFLRLISRTTQGLRVAAVLHDLGRDARRVVDQIYPERLSPGSPEPEHAPAQRGELEPGRMIEYRGEAGILQSVDFRGLVRKAREADALVELRHRIGDLVSEGSPLFEVHGDGGAISDQWLQHAVAVGDERTMRQDPAFAFRLLADISARALSPGVNDPTTSTQAMDQIELLLKQLGGRRLGPGVAADEAGVVRVRHPVPSWEDYLTLAVDETRHFGEGSIQVMRRLRALLEEVRASVPTVRHPAIDVQLALVDAAVVRIFADREDQLAAAVSDRQGLGAGGAPAPGHTAAD